ncbi:MAG: hypothetical protein C0615_06315 [Desulfuromonas sp.]|nr:MAG: hypothetical protein C0615_06315 [Desulfuromonas sp.]
MTENAQPIPLQKPSKKLDGEAVLTAATALSGPDQFIVAPLLKGLRRLVAATDWATEMARIERLTLPAQHFSGPLHDLFELPGDLILLRTGEGSFNLLCLIEQRWLYLGEDGNPLDEDLDAGGDAKVEAVMITRPQGEATTAGFSSLKALWPELKAAWAEVGISSLFINFGQLLLPLFALLIYDKIAMNGLFETLWALVIGMALYLVTDAGMRLIRSWVTERVSIDQALRSDEKLWSKLVAQTDLPPGGFPRFLSNYRDLTQTRDFVSSSYLLSLADIPFLILYLIVIGLVAWPMMIVVAILVLIFAGVGFALYSRQSRFSKEAEQENTSKLAFMGESLNNLDVVRTTPGSGSFLRSWRKLAEGSTRSDTRKRLAAQHMGMMTTSIQTVTTVVVLTIGVYLIHAQMMSIGKLIACNLLAGRAMGQVASLFSVIGKWQDFKRAASRMESSLETVEDREYTPRPDIDGNVSVIGVGKHFEGRPPALENVSFKITPGERIALLGRPGAGKSTLLRCLAGLSQPDTGHILIDGLDLDDISRFDRIKWMTYKAQDPAIFAGTLEENLRVAGCGDAERLSKAIWASGLDVEFNSGRMSLGMLLAERGTNLSGGQRQKVALTRAFAQPSRILLLDEPTLGLDPEGERLLAERLPQLLDESSILLMTTHSSVMLQTVKRIIALDGGKVVADGPREKLLKIS